MPSSRAFSSLATTSAAAPSLMPLAFPAVTVPSARNAGLARRAPRRVVSGRGCSSTSTSPTGDELVLEAPRRVGRRPALLRAQGERVLILARDARSARPRSRPSRPSTRAGTSPRAAGSGSASRASSPRRSGCRAGRPCPALPMTSGARLIDSTPPATTISASPATPRGTRRRPPRGRTRRGGSG